MNAAKYIIEHSDNNFIGIIVEGKHGYGMSSYYMKKIICDLYEKGIKI